MDVDVRCLITWNDICTSLWTSRCRALGCETDPSSDGNRAMWNALSYTFKLRRCAIYCLWDGSTLTMIPFCNADYTNNWPDRAGEGGLVVERLQKTTPFVPLRANWRTWSCNGALVDNWQSEPVDWSRGALGDWHAMLEASCAAHVAGRCTEFILNRRDHPILREGAREPCELPWSDCEIPDPKPWLFANCIPEREGVYRLAPILSQYTSPDFLDVPIPPLAAWRLDNDTEPPPWDTRAPRAVFRGSATAPIGGAASARTRAVRALRGTCHDASLTGHSSRFRFDGSGVIVGSSRGEIEDACEKRIASSMPVSQQAQKYQCAIYIEGNSGADRLAELLSLGFLVAVVRSHAPLVVWLRDGTLVAGVHYLDVASPEDLPVALEILRKSPDRARAIAMAGHSAWRAHMRTKSIIARVALAATCSTVPLVTR